MKAILSAALVRLFFLLLLGSAGLFTTTACHKNDPEVQDYSGIDQDLITNYLASNNITTAQKQPSGLYFLPVLTNPNAIKVDKGTAVSVRYTGHLLDAAGTVFDASSRHNNAPINFVVGSGQLISGFDEGIALMHIGDKAELLIPSGLAYGASTANNTIPANSVLRIEVEVLDFAPIDDSLISAYLTSHNITTAQKLRSGLYFLPVTTNANAVRATAGAKVSVNYIGHLLDAAGTVFDASTTPLPFTLGAGKLIKGFEEGVALMRKGEKAELLIPSALAYGPLGAGSTIAPNAVLRFEIELVDVQ